MIDNPSFIQHVVVEAISSFSWRHNFFIKFFKDILCIRTTYFSNRRKPRSHRASFENFANTLQLGLDHHDGKIYWLLGYRDELERKRLKG
jgi:hypothetical protein